MAKILRHPDRQEIIERLTNGEGVRVVADWLKAKYPKDKSKWVTFVSLQSFRQDKLNIQGQVLRDIQAKKAELDYHIQKQDEERLVQSSQAYQDKINEVAGAKLDVAREIVGSVAIIQSRLESWYNGIMNGTVDLLWVWGHCYP